jgi:hypothetical protein
MFGTDLEKKKGKVGIELDKIEPDSPHGIYVYDFNKDKWVLKMVEGNPVIPWSDGYYVIYFDNAKCPACRSYDNYWFPFVRLFGRMFSNVNFVVVLCDWFARECISEAASGAFRKFDVHASPTTILLRVVNGEIREKKELSGVKKIDELLNIVSSFIAETSRQQSS